MFLIVQGLLKTFMPWVYELIISTTFRNVSKTYGVYVNFRVVASAVNVSAISILYSDIHIPIQQYTLYSMGLLKQTWRFKSYMHVQGFYLCSASKRNVCVY